MRTAGLLALAVLAPSFAHAAVRLNEVAWMGSTGSSNAEWIELANTGSAAVDLAGWRLESSSGAPDITLSGSIAANGFFLLERTSDDSVPGIAADQIYTGSLPNGGTVLALLDSTGTLVDSADGSDSWSTLGGDNTTKDTAQRTSSGWVTAAPTPRAATVSGAAVAKASGDASTTPLATGGSSAAASMYVAPPTGALSVSLQSLSDTVYVNVPARFLVSVKTKSGSADTAASVLWSFGDGSSAQGLTATKTYQYPGTYVVEVRAQDGSAYGEDDVTVTVTQAQVRIAAVTGDGITLANDTAERVDLSLWELFSGTGSFQLPIGTTLLPHTQTLFPYTVVNVPHSYDVSLLYPNRLVAARFEPAPPAASSLSETPSTTTLATASVQPRAAAPGFSAVQRVAQSATPARSVRAVANGQDAERASTAVPEVAAVATAIAALPTSTPRRKDTEVPRSSFLTSPWTLSFLGLAVVAGGALLIL